MNYRLSRDALGRLPKSYANGCEPGWQAADI
jgi:hypothetical protein